MSTARSTMTPAQGPVDKEFSTLQACAALAGHTCTRTSIGNIVLSRQGHTPIFDDVASASAWLDGVRKEIALDLDPKKKAVEAENHPTAEDARSSVTQKDQLDSVTFAAAAARCFPEGGAA